ncbi:TIGR00252 family protein [Selenomonas sp. oral taxon 892 str. F0426]|jgi:TIGR00252 family protein|nr:TIGR00252 family protein [Selenomonas sp. oral taxon 892 str. F0426]
MLEIGMRNKILGDQGESYAAQYLLRKGYRILTRNYRTKVGEIDIIADDHGTLVFIEVKTRSSLRYGTPAEAVHYRKQQKIIQTAYWYLRMNHMENSFCRFDILEIYAAGSDWSVYHIKNAFEA